MDLHEEPTIIIPADTGACPGCSLPGTNPFYCEAKSRYCLTGCEYCRNACPCLSHGRMKTWWYK